MSNTVQAGADNAQRFQWEKAVRSSTLTPGERLAAFVIASYCNGDGRAFPSFETIADGMGQNRSTAVRAVKGLKAAGWLQVEQSGRRRYFLLALPATDQHQVRQRPSTRCTHAPRAGAPMHPEQTTEQTKNIPTPRPAQPQVAAEHAEAGDRINTQLRSHWPKLTGKQRATITAGAVLLLKDLTEDQLVTLLTRDRDAVRNAFDALKWRIENPHYGQGRSTTGGTPSPREAFADGARVIEWAGAAA